MLSLGIDTSNYATSVAAVDVSRREVVCAHKRFLPVKEGELGLRQSDAVFHHTAALPLLLRQLAAEVPLQNVAAVGVSDRPRPQEGSYMPCFLAGVNAAVAFAAGRGLCEERFSHQQGHLAAALFEQHLCHLETGRFLFFHASGGTTELLLCDGLRIVQPLGKSLDLYAGQAVDRLGVKLGYAFPAGAQLSALAAQCDVAIKPKTSVKGMDCHLSGLQNQCEQLLQGGESPAYVAKYCLVALAATVWGMARVARKEYGELPLLCAGGVMCSETIRQYLGEQTRAVYFAAPEYSADNAVGVAMLAGRRAGHGGRDYDIGVE